MRELLHRTTALALVVLACALLMPAVASAETLDEVDASAMRVDPAACLGPDDLTGEDSGAALVAQGESALGSEAWERLAGENRYDTMARIVEERFERSDWVVIASGENFPDALTASALAGAKGCPVLLTPSGELCDQARAQVERLEASHAYVVGGTSAVSTEVVDALDELAVEVERIAGKNRAATSVAVLNVIDSLAESPSDTVIVATGANFPDALSIGPWAWSSASPIVLTSDDGTLTDEGVQALRNRPKTRRVVLVGGLTVVSDAVRSQLGSHEYVRLGGQNRYATSRRIAEWEVGQSHEWDGAIVATGRNYPDALAAAALGGANEGVILLASKHTDTTLDALRRHEGELTHGYLVGGNRAVSFFDPLFVPAEREAGIAALCSYLRTACLQWSLGYDQGDRWNIKDGGECDCSSLAFMALWEAGLISRPAENEDPAAYVLYTGTIRRHLLAAGWHALAPDISQAQPGDLLLNEYRHVCVVIEGYGWGAKIAEAGIDERGRARGGEAGDQNNETRVRDIYDYAYGWTHLLRCA